MTESMLVKFFEHNNWANSQIMHACTTLTDEQLDADPQSVTKGSIRLTWVHLVASQRAYLSLLTLPVESRLDTPLAFAELQESVRISGEGLLDLAREESNKPMNTKLQTKDGYYVEPWVVMLQAINHATEHREQIKSMLCALGITPPDIDGWNYAEFKNALIPME